MEKRDEEFIKQEYQQYINSKEKRKQIQKMFDFCVPDYIRQEIAENGHKADKERLNLLINMAFLCEKITEDERISLKKEFVYKATKQQNKK